MFSMAKNRILAAKSGGTAFEVIVKAGVNPETVLVFRGRRPIPDDLRLKKGDRLTLMAVTTSG